MYEFLTQNPIVAIIFIVAVVVAALVITVKVMQTVGMEKVRAYVYHLFIRAEHEFKYGDNEQKFEYVVRFTKNAIPSPFNMVITESLLRKVVQTWFNLCKDLLDDGRVNGTGKEGVQ